MPSERLDEPKSDAENKGMAMAILRDSVSISSEGKDVDNESLDP